MGGGGIFSWLVVSIGKDRDWNVSRSKMPGPLLGGLVMSFGSIWKVPSCSRSNGGVLDFISSVEAGSGVGA